VDDWTQGGANRPHARPWWRHDYDWRECEAWLNGSGQYSASIDGLDIHFLHICPDNPDARIVDRHVDSFGGFHDLVRGDFHGFVARHVHPDHLDVVRDRARLSLPTGSEYAEPLRRKGGGRRLADSGSL